MRNNFTQRILAIVALFFSLFFLPWWITSALSVVFVLFFIYPFEIFVVGLFLDGLFQITHGNFFLDHAFFISFSALIIASFWLKEHLVFRI